MGIVLDKLNTRLIHALIRESEFIKAGLAEVDELMQATLTKLLPEGEVIADYTLEQTPFGLTLNKKEK